MCVKRKKEKKKKEAEERKKEKHNENKRKKQKSVKTFRWHVLCAPVHSYDVPTVDDGCRIIEKTTTCISLWRVVVPLLDSWNHRFVQFSFTLWKASQREYDVIIDSKCETSSKYLTTSIVKIYVIYLIYLVSSVTNEAIRFDVTCNRGIGTRIRLSTIVNLFGIGNTQR